MADNTFFSEDDIRPARLMQDMAGMPDIGHKREVLLGKIQDFVSVACPACGGNEQQPEFVKNGFAYVACVGCGMVFNNPRPDQEMLAEYYADNPLYGFWNQEIFRKTEAARKEKIVVPRVDKVVELCKEHGIAGGTLVEVGAGFGTFAAEIGSRDGFDRVVAVEPTAALAGTCVERGLETINLPYEEIDSGAIAADVIVSFEVIEHLYAPDDFIEFCRRVLKPGGLLILSFPNMDGFDTMLLREKSGSVGGEHINMFNAESITALLRRHRLQVVDLTTPGQLDAELVRKAALKGQIDLTGQPFLQRVLLDDWENMGRAFQAFLRENNLSSHMMVAAVKTDQS